MGVAFPSIETMSWGWYRMVCFLVSVGQGSAAAPERSICPRSRGAQLRTVHALCGRLDGAGLIARRH